MRAVRIYHSGVVREWRRRDDALRRCGAEVVLVSAQRWNEGGRTVALEAVGDAEVVGAATLGRHPYLFLYDPRPLWRALRRGPIDVLDVHEEAASLAAAEVLLLALLAGRRTVPVCFYCAQNIEKRYPPPFRWIERAVLRRATAAHTCNEEAGRILRRKGFSGIIRNLGLGVDVDRFAPDGAPGSRADGPLVVGYAGRLERHKGVDVLLDAVAGLDGVRLVLVGDGPERPQLEARIAGPELAGRVELRGFADQAELPELYRSFDVLAVPSLETPSWIEQFGRVAVEAMASGVPVVASDSGSLPEVLDGSGVLVPPGDAPALRRALERLRDDPAERARLAEAGRARAQAFSWSSIARRHLDLYVEMTT